MANGRPKPTNMKAPILYGSDPFFAGLQSNRSDECLGHDEGPDALEEAERQSVMSL